MTAKRTVPIESVIIVARGHRVLLAADLARIYGVETRVLNQAVKRNGEKSPEDFMFRLTRDEAESLVRSRSQSVILKRGQSISLVIHSQHSAPRTQHSILIPSPCRLFRKAVQQGRKERAIER
ncbi:MAG: ORF6N domain-containing protein [Nitrospirae bacterium]|nr:ORF6N domain-containing protein [Nitrospirota bacterium]